MKKNRFIYINYDFTTKNEVSFAETDYFKENNKSFETNDLDFFCFDYLDNYEDVIVRKKNLEYISLKELLKNTGEYTTKEIRIAHNVSKMLRTGSFKFKS